MLENDISWSYVYKLVAVGDKGVGKTSLLRRFVTESFDPNIQSTLGVDNFVTTLQVADERVKVQLWDSGGQTRFRSVVKLYFRGASGALAVYDITSPESFANVLQWVDEVRQHARTDAIIILVGNKTDLEARRAVPREEAAEFARAHHLMFMETSALDATNVGEAFRQLIGQVHRGRTKSIDMHSGAPHLPGGRSASLDLEAPAAPARSLAARVRECCRVQ